MELNPYLAFNGNCAEAFKFYERCLNGKIAFSVTYGETPDAAKFDAAAQGRIAHISMKVGDKLLMGGDAPAAYYTTPAGFSVSVNTDTPAEADRIFSDLMTGGVIKMPMAETFYAHRFGMGIDRFGTPWMIGCLKPHGPDA